MNKTILMLSLLLLVFTACEKETQTDDTPVINNTNNRSLHLTIVKCTDVRNDPTCIEYRNLVPAADIYLYETAEHRTEGSPLIEKATTASDGTASFYSLEHGTYYIKVTSAYGVKNIIEYTPNNTQTYRDVLFL